MLAFPRHDPSKIFAATIHTVAVLGTVHNHRHRWNPYESDNRMQRAADGHTWLRWFNLNPQGGRHGDGVYNLRFVINHNPRRSLKLVAWQSQVPTHLLGERADAVQLEAQLRESRLGEGGGNLTIRALKACAVCLALDPEAGTALFSSPSPEALAPVSSTSSYELNGFVWDDADMFAKFDERQTGRTFQRVADDLWEIRVPLRRDGGIDFRRDGVYQFLISRNGDEDQGLAAINSGSPQESLELVDGSGFGSSHGTCRHSAPTIQVRENGDHVFILQRRPHGHRLWVRDPKGETVPYLNQQGATIQLLGSVFKDQSFDPTHPQAAMEADATGQRFETRLSLDPGTYSINFAVGKELFLDTMGLGCWLNHEGPGLRGIGWHGKPNELNIGFHVRRRGLYSFCYDRSSDIFSIDPLGPEAETLGSLEAVQGIDTLSLVGNFPPPLQSWSTDSEQNLMAHLGDGRFEKLISLEEGIEYEFKFVANRSNWQIVFADYELDGYGMAYDAPTHPQPFDTDLAALKRYGHLTSHGNPPTIKFRAAQNGLHRVRVDLSTGAYNIKPLGL